MNKIVRHLMSGVSLAALSLGLPTAANALCVLGAPPDYCGTTSSTVTLNTPQTTQVTFEPTAQFTGGFVVHAGITNSGVGPETGILVDTGAKITPTLENKASITVFAADDGVSHVTAVGIHVDTGADVGRISNALGGLIKASAHDYAHTYVHANATAVDFLQDASMVNDGPAQATAFASEGKYVHAGAVGLNEHEHEYDTGDAVNKVYNYNAGDFGAFAYAKVGSDVGAHATAITQHAADIYAGNATNYIHNSGLIHAQAHASSAYAFDGHADANAIAVEQHIWKVEDGAAHNSMYNLAGGNVSAYATANHVLKGEASANAVGIDQYIADANAGHDFVSNDGHIGAFAVASYARTVNAFATGVDQNIHSAYDDRGLHATNYLYNGAGGHIVASAYANHATAYEASGGSAHAHAIAVDQYIAHASGYVVHNTVHNFGDITAYADVNHAVHGSAVATGVNQVARTVYGAENSVVNHGGHIGAYAFATAYDNPQAHAIGVNQSIIDPPPPAHETRNFVSNSDGHIIAHATALGHRSHSGTGSRHATATATGVHQHIDVGDNAYNTVYNLDGGIIAGHARATNYDALANAYGVHQSVSDVGGAIHNYVSNEGGIFAHAAAIGLDSPGDKATAHATAIAQIATADISGNVHNTVYNNGGIIAAHAYAYAYDVSSVAPLRAGGVSQRVIDTAAATVHDNVSNYAHGVIAAHAYGSGHTARAVAFGITQSVVGGADVYNHVYNAGEINAYAGVFGEFKAAASAGGVSQSINGVGFLGIADNTVVNYGSVYAVAHARGGDMVHATAQAVSQSIGNNQSSYADGRNVVTNYAGGHIEAHALAEDYAVGTYAHATAGGISQHITAGRTALNYVFNSGYISAHATAYGYHQDTARAKGINQFAGTQSAYDGIHGHANNTVINQATVFAYAKAGKTGYVFGRGEHVATAYSALAHADGVKQVIAGDTSAYNYVANGATAGHHAGIIEADAFATAYHAATAHAKGVNQAAYGDTKATNVVVNGTGHYDFEAVIAAHASAHATSDYSHANALADGIDQRIVDIVPPPAHNSAYNHGLVFAFATAKAKASAYATGYGIHQQIVADGGTGHNYASNEGVIVARGFASAYDAYARGTGIAQHVEASSAHNAVVNNGLIFGIATAEGSPAPGSYAHALAADVSQYAAGSTAHNFVANFDGFMGAFAHAKSAYQAVAAATAVYQEAEGGDVSGDEAKNVALNGFGGIVGWARADGYALASAYAAGVVQHASAYTAHNFAGNFFGFIGGYASAYAPDHAFASALGIYQSAYGHDAHNAAINVDGRIDGRAYAQALDGAATAYAAGIGQRASAYTAHNFIGNFDGGHIGATATAYGDHYALAAVDAVYQDANGLDSAKDVAINDGAIVAHVSAYAYGGEAQAFGAGIWQKASAYTARNVAINDRFIGAFVTAAGFGAATATAIGIDQFAHAHGTGYEAKNVVVNDGAIVAVANAIVASSGAASAEAWGVRQQATGYTAHNVAINHEFIGAFASAKSSASGYGADHATAVAVGIGQEAHDDGGPVRDADNFVFNDGAIIAIANATAYTHAFAVAGGIFQEAIGAHATNKAINDGGYIHADAFASAYEHATALAGGIAQFADLPAGGYATNVAHNTDDGYCGGAVVNVCDVAATPDFRGSRGEIRVAATAKATGGGSAGGLADAVAWADADGIGQYGTGYYVHDEADNSGDIHVYAHAIANDASDVAAHAIGIGIQQGYKAVKTAYVFDTNEGHIGAYVVASASNAGLYESAYAFAAGIFVGKVGGVDLEGSEPAFLDDYTGTKAPLLDVEIYNDGRIYANAIAHVGSGYHHAYATAFGIGVGNDAETAYHGIIAGYIENDLEGHIIAEASAYAGHALAVGVGVVAKDFVGSVTNYGYIDAQAFASQYDHRIAIGIGISNNGALANPSQYAVPGHIVNAGGFVYASEGTHEYYALHSGNEGQIGAAIYVGDTAYADGAPNQIDILLEGNGSRMGELFGSIYDSENNAYWVNNITVSNGITYLDGGINPGLASANLDNGGTLCVGATPSGSLCPGATAAGTLWLPSIATSFWANDGYTGSPANPINPILNVASYTQEAGGTLKLDVDGTQNPGLAAGYGNIATINTNAATLAGPLVVNPVAWSYIQNGGVGVGGVNATTGGSWSLFPDSMLYRVVTVENGGTLGGAWSSVTSTTAGGAGSPLLVWGQDVVTGSDGYADLTLTRVDFNAVAGLTPNERGVGTGLENAYRFYGFNVAPTAPNYVPGNANVTSNVRNEGMLLYASLFQLAPTGPAGVGYAATLDSLSDEEAGEIAKSNLITANAFGNALSARLDAIASILGAGGEIAPIGEWTVWGSGYGAWNHLQSTISGPGFNTNYGGATGGVDTMINTQTILGIAGSVSSKDAFTFANTDGAAYSNSGSASGWEIGGYARYNGLPEDGNYYLQGNVTYGEYDDTTQRYVSLPLYGGWGSLHTHHPMAVPPSPPGGNQSDYCATPNGDLPPYCNPGQGAGWLGGAFTEDVWSIYAEGGYPVVTGDAFNLTPYLAFGYTSGDSNSYNESGFLSGGAGTPTHNGPALHVTDASSESEILYLGAQFGAKWQVTDDQALLPSLRVAWAHDFNSDQWKTTAYFDGLGSPSTFTVTGSALPADSAVIDASISAMLVDNLLATLGYDANLNGDVTSQTLFGRLDYKF